MENNILEQLFDFVSNDSNIRKNNIGTLFENTYPIVIVDIVDTHNNYYSLKDFLDKKPSDIKIIRIKNQETEKSVECLFKDLYSIKIKDNSISINYLIDGNKSCKKIS